MNPYKSVVPFPTVAATKTETSEFFNSKVYVTQLKEKIHDVLSRININPDNFEQILSDENMKKFVKSFTHKSFDSENNYELAELIGDGIINSCVVNYLRQTYSELTEVKTITRIKHNIISKKTLASLAQSEDFLRFIRLSKEEKEKMEVIESRSKQFQSRNKPFLSLLEDVFEAFIGTLFEIINELFVGAGYHICYLLLSTFLSKIEIDLTYEGNVDVKTQFKEICDKAGWKLNQCLEVIEEIQDDKKIYHTTITIYPYGKKITLRKVSHSVKAASVSQACEGALAYLKAKKFN